MLVACMQFQGILTKTSFARLCFDQLTSQMVCHRTGH